MHCINGITITNQSAATWIPQSPVAARAFSLRIEKGTQSEYRSARWLMSHAAFIDALFAYRPCAIITVEFTVALNGSTTAFLCLSLVLNEQWSVAKQCPLACLHNYSIIHMYHFTIHNKYTQVSFPFLQPVTIINWTQFTIIISNDVKTIWPEMG